jgi:hypothetical protein
LLEWLIDSIWLMDDNMQWMIASVQSVLDGSESPMEGAEGAGTHTEGEESVWEESAATSSASQPLISTESLAQKWQIGHDKQRFGLQHRWDYGW